MDFAAMLREEKRKAVAARQQAPATGVIQDQSLVSPSVDGAVECPTLDATPLPFRHRLPVDLNSYQVCKSKVSSVYYIPNWLSGDEEAAILERVHAAPSSAWVQLKHRRLQVWGGSVTNTYTPTPLPSWLQVLSGSLVDTRVFDSTHAPNHALINGTSSSLSTHLASTLPLGLLFLMGE
ncbi:hypothetical protein DYB28_014780 [Aphanomyces astaci]|uniref:Uncharacterized protein n=1 Tax=Aphanomyces astaci TaxID=112090 RepID=A0A397BSN4_APHAT|nr:hypothetical protein DYB25_004531 [Aphanomyces astaci]RHY42878.1 hypothetical protein DYB38_005936 [Aphanomyces astaci]RHY59570.1 hypothetical protein DYB30_000984 [Aphanomyces astaci]RHY68788.1 hypothetical protein DYB34_008058 [Aphanomyces astaci]RHZ30961.1 hypothetical protein DYB31_007208 [Aphanomyces astaci]